VKLDADGWEQIAGPGFDRSEPGEWGWIFSRPTEGAALFFLALWATQQDGRWVWEVTLSPGRDGYHELHKRLCRHVHATPLDIEFASAKKKEALRWGYRKIKRQLEPWAKAHG
jgi:hypothetical protein